MTSTRVLLVGLLILAILSVGALMIRDYGDALDSEVSAVMLGNGIDGAVLAYGPIGEAPQVRVYGEGAAGEVLSSQTQFRFASLTKPIISAAVHELVAREQLSLSDTLPTLLPDVTFADQKLGEATVADLLRHTSGIDEGQDVAPLFMPADQLESELGLVASEQRDCAGLAAAMASRPTAFAPSTTTVYSNTGYCYLGLIIERLTKQPLADAIAELVPEAAPFSFDEAALDAGHAIPEDTLDYLVQKLEVVGAAGGLIGSPVDYHAFMARPVAEAVTEPPPFGSEDESYWGMGWRVWPGHSCPARTHIGVLPSAYSVAIIDADNNALVAMFNGGVDDFWDEFIDIVNASCDIFANS